MSSCNQVNDDVLRSLAENCSLLNCLNIAKCSNFTDSGVKHLAMKLNNLFCLNISHSLVTEIALMTLSESPSRQNLTELYIAGCCRLTLYYQISERYLQLFVNLKLLSCSFELTNIPSNCKYVFKEKNVLMRFCYVYIYFFSEFCKMKHLPKI